MSILERGLARDGSPWWGVLRRAMARLSWTDGDRLDVERHGVPRRDKAREGCRGEVRSAATGHAVAQRGCRGTDGLGAKRRGEASVGCRAAARTGLVRSDAAWSAMGRQGCHALDGLGEIGMGGGAARHGCRGKERSGRDWLALAVEAGRREACEGKARLSAHGTDWRGGRDLVGAGERGVARLGLARAARHGEAVESGLGEDRPDAACSGGQGADLAGHGCDRRGRARAGRLGLSWHALAGRGQDEHGGSRTTVEWQGCRGIARTGRASNGWAVMSGRAKDRQGGKGHGCSGKARPGRSGCGTRGLSRRGKDRLEPASRGPAWLGCPDARAVA